MDYLNRRGFMLGTGAGLMTAGLPTAVTHADTVAKMDTVRNNTCFNVRDFGALGNDKDSDTVAIQRALDEAGKVQGTVYFPAGIYPCHDLKVPAHVTLHADPAWIFRNERVGAVLQLDTPDAECLLNITGAYGAHIHGLMLSGIRETPKPVHGIFLNNPEKWSPKEDTVVIDDAKISGFSGHGVYLNRIWLFIIRHSQCCFNGGCGMLIRGWDGFVTDNQFSGNGSHGFGCDEVGATVMFTANRVEWNKGYGLHLLNGDAWNVTGNAFDRNWGAGISATNIQATTITGNLFRRCGKDSNQLAEGEQSCQMTLENCAGITVTGNVFRAGRDDGGKGLYTPQVGFIIKKLSYSIIKDNALFKGYMQEMTVDKGEHGKDFIMKDNVGCPMK